MLRIQIIGFAIVSALLMSAVAAGSASAETVLKLQWLLYHSQSGIHLLLAAPITVHSLGLLLLEDSKATGGAVKIHCHGYDKGTVGPHGLDLIELITAELLGTKHEISCEFDPGKEGLCKAGTRPIAEAIHLPWHTELFLANGGAEIRDLISAHGNGKPGYRTVCENIVGGKSEDVCEEEAGKMGSTLITNDGLAGVLGTFEKVTPKTKCTLGGAAAGTITGTVLTESPSPTLLLLISPLD